MCGQNILVETAEHLQMSLLTELDRSQIEDDMRAAQLQSQMKQADTEAQLLQRHIELNSNPSPMLIIGLVIMVLFVLLILYQLYMKPNMSGIWVDRIGRKRQIYHNTLTGAVTIVYYFEPDRVNNRHGPLYGEETKRLIRRAATGLPDASGAYPTPERSLVLKCKLSHGNAINCVEGTGIWDYGSRINFPNGQHLQRLVQ